LILPHFNCVHNATTSYDLVAANLLSGGFNMNYSRKNTISQQKNDGQSYPLEITQSSGLDRYAVFSRQRVDAFRQNNVASTQSARQYKDATDLICQQAEAYAYLIRRLTPLECERLQGFPDGWTDIPDASDSARYKALGNSVAIPCVEFIISRIAAMLRAA
jgi:site-specific DNA-cytosine methylase